MSASNADVYLTEDVTLAHFLYGLMSAFPLFFMPVMLSFWLNVSQKQVPQASLLAAHLNWQRHSIIGVLPLLVLGYVAPQLWMSLVCYTVAISWFCYRIFKGWLSLHDGIAP
ncbi:conserved hypothetical protein [Shewanella denitrificans OS217]|jgi:uncharacterized membrane protein|uniref:DUF4870 domain-containing protein n=1 Tax=Shewanella denitrificans (strain OS217 / ATCC BAA-1090 / DSM 15013) TaxID=318161 RepID=Q12KJ9_SHEDO|nr:hypothetical protein [Shewanella denitrificans]ABE56027.1 conserved hypothetical protein [Shewanella denitrificans OS217]